MINYARKLVELSSTSVKINADFNYVCYIFWKNVILSVTYIYF